MRVRNRTDLFEIRWVLASSKAIHPRIGKRRICIYGEYSANRAPTYTSYTMWLKMRKYFSQICCKRATIKLLGKN
jgi:hypothetical protein